MASEALVYVNNVPLPAPTQYDVTVVDIDSSETARNELGIMVRNRVRQGARKLNLSWIVKSPQIATMLSAVSPASFTVKFLDPKTYSYSSATMYVGDRTINMKKYTADMSLDDVLWELKMNFIEF